MEHFELELENNIKTEKDKIEEELNSKRIQQEKLEEERKSQIRKEFDEKIAASTSPKEEARLVSELNQKLNRIEERNEINKIRMNEQLRKRLADRKKELTKANDDVIEAEKNEKLKDFEIEIARKTVIQSETALAQTKPKAGLDGPLTEEELNKLLSDSELCSTLESIKNYLDIRAPDTTTSGPITPIIPDELNELERINYQFALFLLGLFNQEWKQESELMISPTIPECSSSFEFKSDLTVEKNKIVLKKKVLTAETGKLAIILSYGFARFMSQNNESTNLQKMFYQIQMKISNDLFITVNTPSDIRNSNSFDTTIRN